MISKGKQNFYPGAFSRSTGDLQSIGFPVKKPDPLVDVYQSDTFVRSFISVQRKLKSCLLYTSRSKPHRRRSTCPWECCCVRHKHKNSRRKNFLCAESEASGGHPHTAFRGSRTGFSPKIPVSYTHLITEEIRELR